MPQTGDTDPDWPYRGGEADLLRRDLLFAEKKVWKLRDLEKNLAWSICETG
jgi:hypothetical protein